jgi:hypothetical protein
MSKYGIDERIALYEEMYTRICEENGPADPVPKALSRRLRGCQQNLVGI